MRIYVPLTLAELADLHASGRLEAYPEPYVADDDGEEAEYAALVAAAEESAERQPGGARRVVLVAEVGREGDPVPLKNVVAVHASAEGAGPDDDLGWFATQEIPDLLG